MSFYIFCQKKRNNPRMDIRVCGKKCDIKDECAEYKSSSKTLLQKDSTLHGDGLQNLEMKAA